MENTIERKLSALLDLQAIDCKLNDITRMRGALPEEVEDLDKELTGLRMRSRDIQEELSQLEQSITTQRVNIKAIEALVKKYEEQQMNVRNNREYGAITKEVDLQKLEIQIAEKRIKSAYERIEEKKIELAQSQVFLEKNEQMLTDKQGALHVLMEESAGEEQKLREERSKVIQQVEEKLLKVYERIRKSARNHLAVVVVKREACGGCFNRVPPQKQADIKEKKSIIVCEHCGRIIADVIPILLEED
jgi:predicted  nucleic acid-binding Zn-ribbon protein